MKKGGEVTFVDFDLNKMGGVAHPGSYRIGASFELWIYFVNLQSAKQHCVDLSVCWYRYTMLLCEYSCCVEALLIVGKRYVRYVSDQQRNGQLPSRVTDSVIFSSGCPIPKKTSNIQLILVYQYWLSSNSFKCKTHRGCVSLFQPNSLLQNRRIFLKFRLLVLILSLIWISYGTVFVFDYLFEAQEEHMNIDKRSRKVYLFYFECFLRRNKEQIVRS